MSPLRVRYLLLALCLLAADAWLGAPPIPVQRDLGPVATDHRRPPFSAESSFFAEQAFRNIVARLLT